jgi:hypothetical protein
MNTSVMDPIFFYTDQEHAATEQARDRRTPGERALGSDEAMVAS